MRASTNAQPAKAQAPTSAQPQISDYSSMSEDDPPSTWISRFLSRKENRFLIHIPDSYLMDDFNLNELSCTVPNFSKALSLILEEEDEESDDEDDDEEDDRDSDHFSEEIHRSAKLLYYLVHQRFLLTRVGMEEMAGRYATGEFGLCPRACCEGTRTIPTGISDSPGKHAFKLFCPRCADVYYPEDAKFQFVDGCAWGTSFAQVFFTTFPPLLSANATNSSANNSSNLSINELEDLNGIAACETVKIGGENASEDAEMLIYNP